MSKQLKTEVVTLPNRQVERVLEGLLPHDIWHRSWVDLRLYVTLPVREQTRAIVGNSLWDQGLRIGVEDLG